MLKYLGSFADRIFAVFGAILLAQAPLFMDQYTLQLAGRTSELQIQVEAMRHAATQSGKTLEQFVHKFIASGDVDFMHQGELMLSLINRLRTLSEALVAMQESSLIERPVAFLLHLKPDIFKSAAQNFSFGLPLTYEGGAYALAGIFIGCLVFAIVKRIFIMLRGCLESPIGCFVC